MNKQYVRWGGWRVKHQGTASEDGRFVGFGWLCAATRDDDSDQRVQVFHESGKGYTYKVLP